MTNVSVMHLIPPFLAGKFVSDAAMVMAGRYAAGSLSDVIHGVLSARSLTIAAVTLVITGAFLFLDWHALLVKKTVTFNFSVFK
jgi:hypothetical protein